MDPTVGKCSRKYILGCQKFIEFAWNNRTEELGGEIYCPCVRCINLLLWPKNVVEYHILNRGILRSYVRWTKHGESGEVNTSHEPNEGDDMRTMLHDGLGFQNVVGINNDDMPTGMNSNESSSNDTRMEDEPNEEAQKFYKLLKEADTPLYPGCTKSSKLSFLVRLLHVKCLNGWSNHSFDMLLEVLNDSLPDDINMPKNHYE